MARNVLILEKGCESTHTYTHRLVSVGWPEEQEFPSWLLNVCMPLYAHVSLKKLLFLKALWAFLRITLLVNHSMNTGLLSEKNAFQNEGTCVVHLIILFFLYCLLYRSSNALLNAMTWNFNSILCHFWVILVREQRSGKPLLYKWLFSWRRWRSGGFLTQFLIWVVSFGSVPDLHGGF